MKQSKTLAAAALALCLLLAACSGGGSSVDAAQAEELRKANSRIDSLETQLAQSEEKIGQLETQLAEARRERITEAKLNPPEDPDPATYIRPMPAGPYRAASATGELAGTWLSAPPEGEGWVYQYRFNEGGEGNMVLSWGLHQSDRGVFYHGGYTLAPDGTLGAVLYRGSFEEEAATLPVYLTLRAQFPPESNKVCVFTLLSIETQDEWFLQGGNGFEGFSQILQVPIPLDRDD